MEITVEIPLELDGKISLLMQELNVSKSALMRVALEHFIKKHEPQAQSPYERAQDLIGVIESNIPDLGSNHEKHLAARFHK